VEKGIRDFKYALALRQQPPSGEVNLLAEGLRSQTQSSAAPLPPGPHRLRRLPRRRPTAPLESTPTERYFSVAARSVRSNARKAG